MSTSASASSLILSPLEFTHSMSKRHYLSLYYPLNNLERQLERHLVFNRLIKAGLMETQIDPGTRNSRRQKTRRFGFHPYTDHMSTSYSRRTPSLLNSHHPPSNVKIQHRRRSFNDSLSSYQSSDDELGTRRNHIYVSKYEDILCEGCNGEGHFILDCTKEYRFDEDKEQYMPIDRTM
jgi:hypothetical protein